MSEVLHQYLLCQEGARGHETWARDVGMRRGHETHRASQRDSLSLRTYPASQPVSSPHRLSFLSGSAASVKVTVATGDSMSDAFPVTFRRLPGNVRSLSAAAAHLSGGSRASEEMLPEHLVLSRVIILPSKPPTPFSLSLTAY